MIKNSTMEYSAPNCKVVRFHVQNLVCTSPYGDMGAAGSNVEVDYDGEDY